MSTGWIAPGGDLGKRHQNETALGHAGMRNLETALVHDRRAEQQDVHINNARAFRREAQSTHRALDIQQRLHEPLRRQFRFDFHHAIQKPFLVAQFDRLGFVRRRLLHDVHAVHGQRVNRTRNAQGAVTNVRSE